LHTQPTRTLKPSPSQLFRDYRVNLLNARGDDGFTALICAAKAREVAAAEALLECAKVLPARLALEFLKMQDTDELLDARGHAVRTHTPRFIFDTLKLRAHQIP